MARQGAQLGVFVKFTISADCDFKRDSKFAEDETRVRGEVWAVGGVGVDVVVACCATALSRPAASGFGVGAEVLETG
jgi:hypothetical protein